MVSTLLNIHKDSRHSFPSSLSASCGSNVFLRTHSSRPLLIFHEVVQWTELCRLWRCHSGNSHVASVVTRIVTTGTDFICCCQMNPCLIHTNFTEQISPAASGHHKTEAKILGQRVSESNSPASKAIVICLCLKSKTFYGHPICIEVSML